ncbi:unnamed protein product [Urochloa decumbens]|uniref:AIPP2-like SPOC-like domain-containing protein n=1 Tax=Urochloa decumbens TaxID=240449 RepID=A0ABC8XRA4_9POAL
MAHPVRPPARHPPNPSIGPTSRSAPAPAPPSSPTTPAARRPDTPRRAAQDTPWAPCVDGSRNTALSQCKQDPRHNQIHQANGAASRTNGIVEPDSSDKLKTPRFSGGTYSKPDARVKLIPAEDITYVQRRKQYGRTVGSAGLQKRHCRRSVTPPPNSRKVSLVGSTSLNQSTKTSASSHDSCLSRKGLDTTGNRRPFARGHITSSVTPQITSLKNPASPSCKSSQPMSTNSNTDGTPRNLGRMDCTKALASSSLSILNSQGQSSKKLSVGLPKGATINPVSPSPKQMRAPHPSEDPVCTKAGPSSKSLCTPETESGKLCSRNIIVTTRSTTALGLQVPVVEPALLSPTSVLSERPIEVCPNTRTAAPVVQEPSVKPVLLSPIPLRNESSMECNNIPPIHSAQSIASTQYGALLQERNSGASIDCSRPSGAPVILHTKLHEKHRQPEGCWKGNFRVTGELFHTCDGLEAHLAPEIYSKAYDASKHMPETLNLEAVPLSQLWPKKFKMEPPDSGDIGLWFVSSHERSDKSFDHLLEKVASHTGLVTKIGDTELAIFSSELLPPNDQRKNGELYSWGVFGKHIRKKRCQPCSCIENVKEVGTELDVTKGRETDTESDIGMALGARGNPTVATGNNERVRDNYEGIAKVLDFTGGKETGRVNDCMAVLGTSDSNPTSSCSAPAASLLNGCHSNDSANKSAFSLEDSACQPADRSSASSDLMLDIPPGFSLDIPPGFTRAHCQPQIIAAAVPCADAPASLLGTPPGFPTDIPPGFMPCIDAPASLILGTPPGFPTDIPPSFMPCADVPPSLILDTPSGFLTDIPPGFTEAHRMPAAISSAGAATRASIPDTEKKPLIRFSLNVPRPVKMEVPPGFTALHAVKKELGLPAVDKATEKQTVTASSMGKAGKADEMGIMDNEVKVEQDENSEEREFPKIRRLVDLYPSDSTEFFQPPHLPDKVQEQAPEKQIHQRKRGRDESPEPAPADTTTRCPNVNGRIALNNSAGQGNGKVRCLCASPEGRAVLPTRATGLESSGDRLDSEIISCRCVVCGEEFPAQ